MILEVSVEEYLVEQTELHGAICEKHVSPGRKGPPDRIIMWDHGVLHFVETKAPDGVLKPWQKRDHKRRVARGFFVEIIWRKSQVDSYVAMCGRWKLWRS